MKKIALLILVVTLFSSCTKELVKPKEGSDLDPNGKNNVSNLGLGIDPSGISNAGCVVDPNGVSQPEGPVIDPDGKPRDN